MRELGVPVTALSIVGNPGSFAALVRLFKICRAGKFDVIQTWMYHAILLAWCAGSRSAPRLCWSVHAANSMHSISAELSDDFPSAGRALVAPFRQRSWCRTRLADGMSARLQFLAMEIHPIGCDIEAFPDRTPGRRERVRRELNIDRDDPVIGLVSRDNPMKDHASFFRAFARMKAAISKLRGVLVGAGLTADNPRLTALASELGILESIRLVGSRAISRI